MRQLLPSDDSLMVILDDSEEVWPNCPNLVVADKFLYFGELHEEVLRFNCQNDVFLKFMAKLLLEVHRRFYSGTEDTKEILASFRSSVLEGCVLVFSGLFPVDESPETQPLWRCAEAHGAQCRREIGEGVTHLIAEVDGTKKIKKARKLGTLIVHRLWLVLSLTYWQQLPTSLFALDSVAETVGPSLFSGSDDSPQPEKRQRCESPD